MLSFTSTLKKKKGFTIVEISIVLMVMSILIGGLLVTRNVYDRTVAMKLSSDINIVMNAHDQFMDNYNGLPGDFIQAAKYLSNNSNGIKIEDGNGNGIIEDSESSQYWAHLIASEILNMKMNFDLNDIVAKNDIHEKRWYMDLFDQSAYAKPNEKILNSSLEPPKDAGCGCLEYEYSTTITSQLTPCFTSDGSQQINTELPQTTVTQIGDPCSEGSTGKPTSCASDETLVVEYPRFDGQTVSIEETEAMSNMCTKWHGKRYTNQLVCNSNEIMETQTMKNDCNLVLNNCPSGTTQMSINPYGAGVVLMDSTDNPNSNDQAYYPILRKNCLSTEQPFDYMNGFVGGEEGNSRICFFEFKSLPECANPSSTDNKRNIMASTDKVTTLSTDMMMTVNKNNDYGIYKIVPINGYKICLNKSRPKYLLCCGTTTSIFQRCCKKDYKNKIQKYKCCKKDFLDPKATFAKTVTTYNCLNKTEKCSKAKICTKVDPIEAKSAIQSNLMKSEPIALTYVNYNAVSIKGEKNNSLSIKTVNKLPSIYNYEQNTKKNFFIASNLTKQNPNGIGEGVLTSYQASILKNKTSFDMYLAQHGDNPNCLDHKKDSFDPALNSDTSENDLIARKTSITDRTFAKPSCVVLVGLNDTV